MNKLLLSTFYCATFFGLQACNRSTSGELPQANITNLIAEEKGTSTSVTTAPTTGLAAFLFDHIEYNFGKVPEGTKVKHTFKFKNIGEKPLIIAEVHPQCGCTSSEYTKAPVVPNGQGEITLELDTSNKKGQVEKNARVVANVEGGTVFLFLKGEIISEAPPSTPYSKPH